MNRQYIYKIQVKDLAESKDNAEFNKLQEEFIKELDEYFKDNETYNSIYHKIIPVINKCEIISIDEGYIILRVFTTKNKTCFGKLRTIIFEKV